MPTKTKATARRTARVMWVDPHFHRLGQFSMGKSQCDRIWTLPVLVLPLDPASCAERVEAAAKAVHDTRSTSIAWRVCQPGSLYREDALRIARAALSAVDPRLVGDIRRERKAGKGGT